MMDASVKQQNIWQIPPVDLRLKKDEIHVWLVHLDQENITEYEQIISTDELIRADKFRFQSDRNRFIKGRGILRKILGGYLRADPNKLRFSYNQFGKPYLCGKIESKLRFNLSHSENLALYAFGFNREVGIDIEQRKVNFIEEGVISICLTQKETEHFYSLTPIEQNLFFFDCWTKKEAYLKANGCGLSFSPNEVETSDLSKTPFSFQNLPAIEGFSMALSVQGNKPLIKFWQAK
jgi:4'-phosphopantetheinyl transferase